MPGLKGLSSDQLLARLLELVQRDRKLDADLIAYLAEFDERMLLLPRGGFAPPMPAVSQLLVLAHLFAVTHLLTVRLRLIVPRRFVLAHLFAPRVASSRALRMPKIRKPRSSMRTVF